MTTETTDIRSHFGLSAMPFTREIRVVDRWPTPSFDDVLEALHATVKDRMSAALIAPAGTGKTMLLRTLRERLPEARYRVHYVKVTSLSKRDFCRELCDAVDAHPAGTFNAAVRSLQSRLRTLLDQDSLRPVVVIDEAHDMRLEVLAILRILTNFSMDSRLVVSVLLAGQPPLARMLRRQELEALTRRLAHCATLRLLSRAETTEYLRHRLSVAGSDGDLFDQPAHDALYENAGGNLRATDRLALKAMQQAAKGGAKVVGAEHVVSARKLVLP